MFEQKRAYWRSLDNAAKLFSAASSPKDTRVFRFYCELKEEVKEEILQEALNQTIQKYPVHTGCCKVLYILPLPPVLIHFSPDNARKAPFS